MLPGRNTGFRTGFRPDDGKHSAECREFLSESRVVGGDGKHSAECREFHSESRVVGGLEGGGLQIGPF